MEHTQAGSMQEETRLPPSRGVSYIPYLTIPYHAVSDTMGNSRKQHIRTTLSKFLPERRIAKDNARSH